MAELKIQGGVVLVDEELIPLLSAFHWGVDKAGYALGGVNTKRMFMHRLIMGAKKGDIVDHLNNNRLDNRRVNLRFATRGQNGQNSRRSGSKPPFIGVSLDKGYIKAGIKYHNKRKHLGCFKTEIEAAIAYDKAALQLFGPDARTNLKHYEQIVVILKGGAKAGDEA